MLHSGVAVAMWAGARAVTTDFGSNPSVHVSLHPSDRMPRCVHVSASSCVVQLSVWPAQHILQVIWQTRFAGPAWRSNHWNGTWPGLRSGTAPLTHGSSPGRGTAEHTCHQYTTLLHDFVRTAGDSPQGFSTLELGTDSDVNESNECIAS